MVDMQLEVLRCPAHGFMAISVSEANGSGTRLTEGKCCGRWEIVKAFRMTPRQLREAAEELNNAANEAESEPSDDEDAAHD